mmetsp:Transcript_5997/g.23711  ORF Transcript_5997/g.23711 Transcript_5997/m.23711 type:complete len:241 (-) Transcript_5997:4064-4786(-)
MRSARASSIAPHSVSSSAHSHSHARARAYFSRSASASRGRMGSAHASWMSAATAGMSGIAVETVDARKGARVRSASAARSDHALQRASSAFTTPTIAGANCQSLHSRSRAWASSAAQPPSKRSAARASQLRLSASSSTSSPCSGQPVAPHREAEANKAVSTAASLPSSASCARSTASRHSMKRMPAAATSASKANTAESLAMPDNSERARAAAPCSSRPSRDVAAMAFAARTATDDASMR